MMREKSRARRRVRTRVALFLSLASLAGLYLIRLLGAALHAAGLSAVALSTAGTLLCFLLPALAGVDTVFYLVHAMGAGAGFHRLEQQRWRNLCKQHSKYNNLHHAG